MKVEINTLFVKEERFSEMKEATADKDINIKILGEQVQLLDGITIYKLKDEPVDAASKSLTEEEMELDYNIDLRKDFDKINFKSK